MNSIFAGLVGGFAGVGLASVFFGLLRGEVLKSAFGLLCLLFAVIVPILKGADFREIRMWCIGLGCFIFTAGVTGIILAYIRSEPILMHHGVVFSIAGVCFLLVAWGGKFWRKTTNLPS